jgi:hypothetical protein
MGPLFQITKNKTMLRYDTVPYVISIPIPSISRCFRNPSSVVTSSWSCGLLAYYLLARKFGTVSSTKSFDLWKKRARKTSCTLRSTNFGPDRNWSLLFLPNPTHYGIRYVIRKRLFAVLRMEYTIYFKYKGYIWKLGCGKNISTTSDLKKCIHCTTCGGQIPECDITQITFFFFLI